MNAGAGRRGPSGEEFIRKFVKVAKQKKGQVGLAGLALRFFYVLKLDETDNVSNLPKSKSKTLENLIYPFLAGCLFSQNAANLLGIPKGGNPM